MKTASACFIILFGATTSLLAGADADWKVGLAHVKITPEQPVLMSGYAGRNKPFEKVAADLFVKAMVFQDSKGERAALVTSDLLGFPAEVTEPIREAIVKKTGLKPANILFNSSHTHAGPLLSVKVSVKGITGDGLREVEYTHWLQGKVVEAVVQAAARLEPARLSWSTGVANFVMNRREFTPSGIILGVNPRGLADRTVPVLRVDGPDGKLRAVLFGAAVHGTTLGPDNYQLCGDYAGFAQAYIQERYPDAQALFMLGCAGDANPYPRGTMDLARQHGQALGEEVCRVLEGKFKPVRGPLQIASGQADLPLAALTKEQVAKLAADKRHAQNTVAVQVQAMLAKGEKPPTNYPCPFTVWQFGQDLTLAGLPGEVVVEYVTLLEKALGPNQLWIAGYCNDVFGYLPTARVLKEGGYETRGLYSGAAGIFGPEVEEVVIRKVRELARASGAKNARR